MNKQASVRHGRKRNESESTDFDLSPPDRSLLASTPAATLTPGTILTPKFNFQVAKPKEKKFISTTPSPRPKRVQPQPKARLTKVRFDIDFEDGSTSDGQRKSQVEREKTPPPTVDGVKRVSDCHN